MRVLSDLTKDDCPYLRLISFKGDTPFKVEFVRKGKTYTTYNVNAQEVSKYIKKLEEQCKSLKKSQTATKIMTTLKSLKELLPTL